MEKHCYGSQRRNHEGIDKIPMLGSIDQFYFVPNESLLEYKRLSVSACLPVRVYAGGFMGWVGIRERENNHRPVWAGQPS